MSQPTSAYFVLKTQIRSDLSLIKQQRPGEIYDHRRQGIALNDEHLIMRLMDGVGLCRHHTANGYKMCIWSFDSLDCVPQELASDSFFHKSIHDLIPICTPLRVSRYFDSCADADSR